MFINNNEENEVLDERTINFNNMIANKVGLICKDSGEMAFINDELMVTNLYYKGKPVMAQGSINSTILGGLSFDPLHNKNLMKSIFDYFIENDTTEYRYDDLNDKVIKPAFIYDKPYVLVYGRCKSPYKNDRRSCIALTMSDGSDFVSSPYYNDSLKYLECIDYLIGNIPYEGIYNEYDSSLEEMRNKKGRRL